MLFFNPQRARWWTLGSKYRAHMCVSTPLCNAWAITHYIERKGARKACIRCVRSARAVPSFLFSTAIWMRGVGGGQAGKKACIHHVRFLFFCCCLYPKFKDSCTSFPEGCVCCCNLWNEKDPTRERESARQ